MNTCSAQNCVQPTLFRGLCRRHYRAWLSSRGLTCRVKGCDNPFYARGCCVMHYERLRSFGAPGGPERLIGPSGAGSIGRYGYRILRRTGHPLARAQGKVFEHRLVLYERIGPGRHPCHWCSATVSWDRKPGTAALVADHLDGDRLNNDPTNMVPACIPCNTHRSVST